MKSYIARISSPPMGEFDFVEERRLIVVAKTPEAADVALRKLVPTNWSYTLTDEQPRPGYLPAANLQVFFYRRLNP